MRIRAAESLCVIVDVQQRLFPHMHAGEHLLERLKILIRGLRVLEIPLVVTQQYTRGLGPTIDPLLEVLGEFDPVEKIAFSCCGEKAFIERLGTAGRKRILLAGIESHVCVLQTAVDLAAEGYTPAVVADCVSSRYAADKEIALRRYEAEGAILTTSESILFELTREAGTPVFKQISALVK